MNTTLGHKAVIPLVVGCSLGMSGCESLKQYQEEKLISLRNSALENMRVVRPHVKAEHLEQCKKLLQQKKTMLGDSFRVVADFNLSVRHSCAVRNGPLFSTKKYPTAAFVTMVQQYNSNGKVTDLPKQGACGFRLKAEEIEVFVARTSGIPHDPCHHI